MHKPFKLVIVALISLSVVGCLNSDVIGERRLADSPEAVTSAKNSVVALVEELPDGLSAPQCTAFFVGPRLLATAYHCVKQPQVEEIMVTPTLMIRVPVIGADPTIGSEVLFITNEDHHDFIENYNRMREPNTHRAFVIQVSSREDVALLHLAENEPDSLDWFPMALNLPQAGERIYEIGMPNNQFWLFTEGMVSAIRKFPNGRKAIIHDANVSPGASGGPVFNNLGQVVGITTSFARGTFYIGFAVPIYVVQNLASLPFDLPIVEASAARTPTLDTSVICEKTNCSLLNL